MYSINWTNKAKKQLRKIDRQEQVTIIDAIDKLEMYPQTKNIIPLSNHEYGYRMRVGNYRVLFDIDTVVRIIDIQQIKRRNEQTY
ncbi:type II toxin-antitoxin system RelE family toxin [Orrella sp. 11846]|uniref:type II toxin-antitoxin system RelE family toxin n=1 Tax=Orrella sp. 11846 TaxID=3409913 RepID=UPI003B58F613